MCQNVTLLEITCRGSYGIQATSRLQSSLSGMQVLNAYLSNGSCYQPERPDCVFLYTLYLPCMLV